MSKTLESKPNLGDTGSSYRTDLFAAFIIRAVLFAAIIALLAVFAAGCSRSANDPISLGAENRLKFPADDLEPGTRNSLPQGGNYEKSDCAPRKPME